MSRSARLVVGLLGFSAFLGVSAATARADDAPKVTAKSAFKKIKSLAGEWSAESKGEHLAGPTKVMYKVTAAGSAVVQTQFPGTGHEMVTVYHLDGDDLKATHYCAAGNQPRMKLDKKASKPDSLVFAFDGGTNFDPDTDMHIHGFKTNIRDEKHVTEEWESYTDGKKAETTVIEMSKP